MAARSCRPGVFAYRWLVLAIWVLVLGGAGARPELETASRLA
jgi:hypothetical protein